MTTIWLLAGECFIVRNMGLSDIKIRWELKNVNNGSRFEIDQEQ